MKNLLALSFSIAIFFLIGCAGGASSGSVNLVTEASTEIIDLEPVWWLNPEEREGYVVGKAEGVSRDKGGARMKAQNMLINDFRQRTKSIAEGRSENFFKETGEDLDSEIIIGRARSSCPRVSQRAMRIAGHGAMRITPCLRGSPCLNRRRPGAKVVITNAGSPLG